MEQNLEKFPRESNRIQFIPVIGCIVRGPGTILKELWTKKVNIFEAKTSYEYVTELHECLRLAHEELLKECYRKHNDKMAKPRRLEVGDQVLILLPADSYKLLMQCRGPYMQNLVGANDYRVEMGSKTKTYHVNIARESNLDLVPTSNKDDTTVANTLCDSPRY